MADVHFICMRDAAARAEKLASLFEAAGRTIGGPPTSESEGFGAAVVVWSESARGSLPFMQTCEQAAPGGRTIVVRACRYPLPDCLSVCPTFDLAGWRGDRNDPALRPFLAAVETLAPGGEDDLVGQVRYWRAIDPLQEADLRGYLARFGPDGYFSDLAAHRLSQMRQPEKASAHASHRPIARDCDWSFWRPLGVITALGAAAAAAALYFAGADMAPPAFATPTVEMSAPAARDFAEVATDFAPQDLRNAPQSDFEGDLESDFESAFEREARRAPARVTAAREAPFKAVAANWLIEPFPEASHRELAPLDDSVATAWIGAS